MALYTLRTGATAHPEDSVLQHLTDQISSSGVFDFAGNDFKVQAQGTPDLTVKVIKGRAYIKAVSGNSYPIRADADSNVSIGSNSSGNPRIDSLVLFIDLSAAPNSDASNVAKLQVVAGTPAPSPSVPSDVVIQAEIGASNPFIRLANISVASGATSITNPNITDTRVVVGFKVGKVELTEGRVSLLEQVTPATPASGKMLVYPKSDNKLYKLDDLGVESEVGAGAGEFMPNMLENGAFINNSSIGYGSTPDNWLDSNANARQGGFPVFTKQMLMDILGITTNDIEGLWNLNGNYTDLSDNGYNLTPVNAPTDVPGLMSQAKNFVKSSSQHATNTTVPNLRMAGSQTMFCLFKSFSVTAGAHRIMGVADSTPTNYVNITQIAKGYVGFGITGIAGTFFPLQRILPVDSWYFVICSYDSVAQQVRMLINGLPTTFGGATGTHVAGSGGFSMGRMGDYNADYWDGYVQNAGVLSVALTTDQMKNLWAALNYKNVKLKRSGTNGFIRQDLPLSEVQRLKGKTVTLGGEFYQDTANIGALAIEDGVSSINSTPVPTTGSWLEESVSLAISPLATRITVYAKVNTTDGNSWFKELKLTESDALVKFTHSKSDWIRFGDLIRLQPPRDGNGMFHYEINRTYPWALDAADITFSHATTYVGFGNYGSSYEWLNRTTVRLRPRFYLGSPIGGVMSHAIYVDLYVATPAETSGDVYGITQFYGSSGPGPGSYHVGAVTVAGSFVGVIFKYDGSNITVATSFLYCNSNLIYNVRQDI